MTKDLWAEFWALMNTPRSEMPGVEIFYAIVCLILAVVVVFLYKRRRQKAEELYRAKYPAPQYPAPHSMEEKERWVRKKERHLKLFYGIGFWVLIGVAGMYLYFYMRAL